MSKPLLGKKLAVLVANGFCEEDFISLQKALQKTGMTLRIVSMDHGLVNAWQEEGWGLHFASDQVLSSALAADYSMLYIPGGERSIRKLQLTAHTKRFISSFINAGKPIAVCEEAAELVEETCESIGGIASHNIIQPKEANISKHKFAEEVVDFYLNTNRFDQTAKKAA